MISGAGWRANTTRSYSEKVAVTDSDGGSIAIRLAKMSDAERAAWAAGVAAQARDLLEAPTIDHEDR